MKSKFIRIKLATYRRLKEAFLAVRGESVASYFERLSRWIYEAQTQLIKQGF